MLRNKASLAAALLLGACTYQSGDIPPQPTDGISLAATPPAASPGSPMSLTLSNGSQQAIGYNLCTSQLQTVSGSVVRTDRVCTLELRTLEPGRTTTYSYELPTGLPAGQYRFTTDVERMQTGGRTSVTSNAFQVS